MKDFAEIINQIQSFQADSLSIKIASLEETFQGANANDITKLLAEIPIDEDLLKSALQIKSLSGQINVIIHTIGILLSLPEVLREGEKVLRLSLGAGNTGRDFDLETNFRIAEYKFIHWQGGAEAIRQNQLFKDFYELAEFSTLKEKFLYVLGVDIPMKFFKGRRALSSIFSKNNRLWQEFQDKYGDRFQTVHDYYEFRKNTVRITDLRKISPIFTNYYVSQDTSMTSMNHSDQFS